jgi:hypothetical protein
MDHKYKSAGITLALLFAAFPAFANHGLDALGAAIEILMVITVIIAGITCAAFVIAGRNISRKSKNLRIVSFVLSIPLVLLTFVGFTIAPVVGFICGAVLIILLTLIYKSYEPADESGNAG